MGVLFWWYIWGIWFGLLVGVAVVVGILYDSRRKMLDATVWLIGTVVGVVLMLPSLYFRIDPAAAFLDLNLVTAFGVLGLLGILVCIGAGIGYIMSLSRAPAGGGYDPIPPPGPVDYGLPPTEVVGPPPAPQKAPPQAPPRAPQLDPTRVVDEAAPVSSWLIVRSGPRAGKQLGLSTSARNTIGRDGTRCDLILDDPAASREHARIQWEHGQFVLYDLASANGTWVNDRRVQRQSLLDDDVVRVGDTTMVFKSIR